MFKKTLILGCGNLLFGDDGFGPEFISYLTAHHKLPAAVEALDMGTSVRDLLFDLLLAPEKPEKLILIDALDFPGEKKPGEIFEIDLDRINPAKTSDFSLHQFPTTNMLKELSTETNVKVHILGVQIDQIPEFVSPGLSPAVQKALPGMCTKVLTLIGEN